MGKRNGQVWSIDVIMGVTIFLVVIGIVYYNIQSSERDERPARLAENAETVLTQLEQDSTVQVIVGQNELNRSKLEDLTMMNYDQLKQRFGIQGDFCLYLKNERGKVVPIDNQMGIGNPAINVSGVPCNSTV